MTVAKTSDDSASAVAAARAGQIGSLCVGASSSARQRAISSLSRFKSAMVMATASPLARAAAKPMRRL